MSATAIYQTGADQPAETAAACRILILHETFSAYARAVEVCRRVMQQLGGEVDFDIKSWSFVELADPACARHATKTATAADVILLAMQSGGTSNEMDGWLEQLPLHRSKDDGLLALLVEDLDGSAAALERTLLRLNDCAARLGTDFVTLFPESESIAADAFSAPTWHALAPAREIADSPTSDHWGLNE